MRTCKRGYRDFHASSRCAKLVRAAEGGRDMSLVDKIGTRAPSQENPRRWVLFPIQYPAVFEMYKKHEAAVRETTIILLI